MSQSLPMNNFIWENSQLWTNKDGSPKLNKILNLGNDDQRGYLFEVDIGMNYFHFLVK